MHKAELARNLAYSLTLGAWSAQSLDAALSRRLPTPLARLTPPISDDLISALPSPYAPTTATVAEALRLNRHFERVFRYCQRRNHWPDADLTSPVMAPVAAFADLDVPQLPTLGCLADWLGLPPERLDYLADIHARYEDHGETSINHYHYILKPKKSGGMRVIEAPKKVLKSVQRQILRAILDKVPTHRNAFGFVKGRSCLDAASRHAGEEIVLCFDLQNFFPSVGSGRIFGLFRCLGYPNSVARHLTALCTTVTPTRVRDRLPHGDQAPYKAPHLPQGSPASPALANHVAFTLDRRLSGLAKHLGVNYSRYADDLSFSGDRHIAGPISHAVSQIAQDEGFSLNPTKTRIMAQASRQVVTSIVVNRHLNIDRDRFDQLKAVIHACGKAGDRRIDDLAFRASLLGQIEWAEAVNPSRGGKLRRLLYAMLTKAT